MLLRRWGSVCMESRGAQRNGSLGRHDNSRWKRILVRANQGVLTGDNLVSGNGAEEDGWTTACRRLRGRPAKVQTARPKVRALPKQHRRRRTAPLSTRVG